MLGGTVFLSRAVAEEAVRRGHGVTAACRGASGRLPNGVRHIAWDRAVDPVPEALTSAGFDAVVDVARHPSWVRTAVAALPDAHWVFVSTINVYADDATPGGGPGTLPLREPLLDDVDLREDPEAYGPMKVGCEQLVAEGAPSHTLVRPGLIIGPGDPSGRFTYWPARLAEAGSDEVLAPGDPEDLMQVIDARDLAAWIVDLAEQRRGGVFDGTGPAVPLRQILDEAAAGVGTSPRWTWVDQEFLAEQEVVPWMGPRSVPLFLPRPEYDGMPAHDLTPSFEAGLTVRPLSETARDTLAWLREHPDAAITGLTRDEELEVLAAWRRVG